MGVHFKCHRWAICTFPPQKIWTDLQRESIGWPIRVHRVILTGLPGRQGKKENTHLLHGSFFRKKRGDGFCFSFSGMLRFLFQGFLLSE